MAIAKQKKSQTLPRCHLPTSSVSAWALSLRYGNKAEKLSFFGTEFALILSPIREESTRVQYILPYCSYTWPAQSGLMP